MHLLYIFKPLLVTSVLFICSFGFNLDINHSIVYEDPLNETGARSSYFGFSVLLYSGSQSKGIKPWIQIGAPRGNDSKLYPHVREPGMVFRCHIGEPCKIVKLDNVESKKKSGLGIFRYEDQKKYSWIGGAMDIQEETGRIVVCGHRWRNTLNNTLIDFMIGVCYLSTIEHDITSADGVHKLLPLLDPDKYFTYVTRAKLRTLNYGTGQAGISVHFPPNKSAKNAEILIGAPGVYLGRGTTVCYKHEIGDSTRFVKPEVVSAEKIYNIRYFGYEVNSGEFYPKRDFMLLEVLEVPTIKEISSTKILIGEKTGEYFGSSIAVADINGDKLDDLIVGSPLYTILHDEGCIYLFVANSQSTMFNKAQKTVGSYQGARFGTTIASLGDLDKDGYDDIAVGAPFENNNVGAIYIYNGGPSGLTMSQKIVAENISPILRGFGISIARPADIDDNKYADIAVGAFQSGQVILFRARPVIFFQTIIYTDVFQLQKNMTEFNVTVCLSYSGSDVPYSLNVTREIILDPKHERASISGARKPYKHAVEVNKNGVCDNLKINLKKKEVNKHLLEPISMTVTQELVNNNQYKNLLFIGKNESEVQDTFNKYLPVVNEKVSTKTAQLFISYATECGDDNICDSELQLKSHFINLTRGTFIIGSKTELKLNISLTNLGEPAYMAGFNITIPAPIRLAKGHGDCQENISSQYVQLNCYIDNPLDAAVTKSLILQLEMRHVKVGIQHLIFNISPYTKSRDKNLHKNSQDLQLNLTTNANVIITGKSQEDVYSYFKSNITKFEQIYEVNKIGESPIEVVEIDLNIPLEWRDFNGKEITILKFSDLKTYLNDQPLKCSSGITFQPEEDVPKLDDEEVGEIRAKRNIMKMQNEARGYEPPANRTLYLNCSTSNVVCHTIHCTAGPFIGTNTDQSSALIVMSMFLHINNLGSLMGKKDIIYLSTTGSVTIKKPDILKTISGKHLVTVSSVFIGSVTNEVVATWIIALSIIAGILLFMFLVIGLIKAGFFDRKKKDELKALKAVDAMDEFTGGKVQSYDVQQSDKEDD